MEGKGKEDPQPSEKARSEMNASQFDSTSSEYDLTATTWKHRVCGRYGVWLTQADREVWAGCPHCSTDPEEISAAGIDSEPGDRVTVRSDGEVVEAVVRTKQTVQGAYGKVVILGCQLGDRVDTESSWVTVVCDPAEVMN